MSRRVASRRDALHLRLVLVGGVSRKLAAVPAVLVFRMYRVTVTRAWKPVNRGNYCMYAAAYFYLLPVDIALFASIMYVYAHVVTVCKCDNLYTTHPDTFSSLPWILDISRRHTLRRNYIEHGSLDD